MRADMGVSTINTNLMTKPIKGKVTVEIHEVEVDIRAKVVFVRGTVITELFRRH